MQLDNIKIINPGRATGIPIGRVCALRGTCITHASAVGVVWSDSAVLPSESEVETENPRTIEVVDVADSEVTKYLYKLVCEPPGRWSVATMRLATREQARLSDVIYQNLHHTHPMQSLFAVIALCQSSHIIGDVRGSAYALPRTTISQGAWAARFAAVDTYSNAQTVISEFADYIEYDYPHLDRRRRPSKLTISKSGSAFIRYNGAGAEATVEWDNDSCEFKFGIVAHNNRVQY